MASLCSLMQFVVFYSLSLYALVFFISKLIFAFCFLFPCSSCDREMVLIVGFFPDVHLLIKIDVYRIDKWGLIEEEDVRMIKDAPPRAITIYHN